MENRSRTGLVSVDIGCGDSRQKDARYGVDRRPGRYVDVVCDVERGLPFKSGTVDVIYASHFLEHVHDLEAVLREFIRVLRPGGRMSIIVPHFSNTLAFSDYTHKRFFGYYTFDYFSRTATYKYGHHYAADIDVRILRKRLVFTQLSFLSPVVEYVFNKNDFLSYLYESRLAWLIPCFEIRFELALDGGGQEASISGSPPAHEL